MQHVPRRKHIAIDSLLRRLQTKLNNIDKQYKTDIKAFINAELRTLLIALVQANATKEIAREDILEDRYLEDL